MLIISMAWMDLHVKRSVWGHLERGSRHSFTQATSFSPYYFLCPQQSAVLAMSFAFCGPAVGLKGAKCQQVRGRVSLRQSCGVRRNCPWLDVFWGCQWGKEPSPVQGRVSKWYPQEGQQGLCLNTTARDRQGL